MLAKVPPAAVQQQKVFKKLLLVVADSVSLSHCVRRTVGLWGHPQTLLHQTEANADFFWQEIPLPLLVARIGAPAFVTKVEHNLT